MKEHGIPNEPDVTSPDNAEGQYLTSADINSLPIVIDDTGASRSLSPRRTDFVTYTSMSTKLTALAAADVTTTPIPNGIKFVGI
mgnify:CR=1 FL=1